MRREVSASLSLLRSVACQCTCRGCRSLWIHTEVLTVRLTVQRPMTSGVRARLDFETRQPKACKTRPIVTNKAAPSTSEPLGGISALTATIVSYHR